MRRCVKCQKEFANEKKVQEHLDKKVPCDFKCIHCNFIGRNRYHYYRHVKDGCPQPCKDIVIEDSDNEIVTIKPMSVKRNTNAHRHSDDKFPIPITDVTDPEFIQRVVEYATTNDCEVVIAQTIITVKPIKKIDAREARIQRMTKNINNDDFNRALKCLESTHPMDLVPHVVDNLTQIHGDYKRKDLQSILMTDMARKNVKLCTRDEKDDMCKWTRLPKGEAIYQLSSHSSNLLSSFLAEIIPKLSKCAQKTGNVVKPCLALFDPSKINDPEFEAEGFIVYEEESEEDSFLQMFMDKPPRPVLKVSYERRIRYVPIQNKRLNDLYNLVQQRKDEIVELLRELVLTEKDLTPFLQRTCGFI